MACCALLNGLSFSRFLLFRGCFGQVLFPHFSIMDSNAVPCRVVRLSENVDSFKCWTRYHPSSIVKKKEKNLLNVAEIFAKPSNQSSKMTSPSHWIPALGVVLLRIRRAARRLRRHPVRAAGGAGEDLAHGRGPSLPGLAAEYGTKLSLAGFEGSLIRKSNRKI